MFRVKCKVADWCEGNDRGYYRKPKEFIYTNKFETEKEAQEFMEKEKAKHIPPQRRTSIYSDYEVIKDLDESFDVYKKDQKYNIIYADKDGKDNEFKFTPEEDMSKPEMIMKCKEANKNFVKLKEIKKLEEGVRKMEETKKFETLADIIEDRYKKGLEGLDVGDNTIDMIVYFDYNPEDVTNSADTYSKCLDTIATGTKVVNYDEEGAYAVVDFYNYVIDHLNAFTSNFTINIDPADGEDNETIAANIVEGILPGLISGYTDDHTYNSLDTDLLMGVQKKEEKKEQYTLDNIDDAIHEIRSKIAKQRAYDRRRDAVCLSIGDDDAVYKPMYDELKRLNAIKKDLQSNKEIKKESFESGNKTFELKLDIRNLADDDEEGPLSDEAITAATSDEFAQKFGKALANELSKTNLEYTDEGNITLFNGQVSGKYCFGYEGVISLGESKGKKEESFENNKKFMAGEILAIIDRYIHTSDLENLFKDMDIDQSIYEGDKEIPEGKIQDIVEVGLQWLFDHLQPEDYKRVLKNDLEMTDEEMEKYGVELEESKKIEEGTYLDEFTTLVETDYFKLIGERYQDKDFNEILYDLRVIPTKKSEYIPDIYLSSSSANAEIGHGEPVHIGTTSFGSKGPNDIREIAEWLNAAAEFVDLINQKKSYKDELDKTEIKED